VWIISVIERDGVVRVRRRQRSRVVLLRGRSSNSGPITESIMRHWPGSREGMRITAVKIRNYRSLKSIEMDGLRSMVVLIGGNGSGKSNLLEALELFFSDLNLQSDAARQFEASTWFDKRTTPPIDFDVTMELDDRDFERIFDDEVMRVLKGDNRPSGPAKLRIHRRIVTNLWRNVEAELEGHFQMKDGKIIASPLGQETREPPFEPELPNLLFAKFHALLKNQFRLIRGPRESPERPDPMSRGTVIDPETRSRLISLANSSIRDEEDLWINLDETYQQFSGRPLRVRGQLLEFIRGNLLLPIEAAGSGDQALLILLRSVIDGIPLIGIEEPETRLHHDYQRRLFEYLKSLAVNR